MLQSFKYFSLSLLERSLSVVLFLVLWAELEILLLKKVINIQLNIENKMTKKLKSWETSEDGSTETGGYSVVLFLALWAELEISLLKKDKYTTWRWNYTDEEIE